MTTRKTLFTSLMLVLCVLPMLGNSACTFDECDQAYRAHKYYLKMAAEEEAIGGDPSYWLERSDRLLAGFEQAGCHSVVPEGYQQTVE